ncbi:MAG: diguanylate cyclase [Hyphomicrobiales bacterium]
MHVVLVDPSRAVRSAVTALLEPAGHVVIGFADPDDALDRIKADETVDAVITASELTPISGVELCWEVRLIAGEQRPIYVAMMSSNHEGSMAVEALDVGADDLLHKPLQKQELCAKLRSAERLLMLQRKLIRLATTDPLTGLLNRRAFFERATEICANASNGRSVAAILFDIDYFKEINDLYGHHIGDNALRAVARYVRKDQPVVGRLGGDEICILLKSCDQADALKVAEALRVGIASLHVVTSSGRAHLTCSLGVAELEPGEDVDDLIKKADLALYRAKREGRDCVASPPPTAWRESNPRTTPGIARASRRRPQASLS